MESEEAIMTIESEEKVKEKKPSHTINLFYVRLTVCLVILGSIMFTKISYPCVFENFRFWYQNNVCEEKFSAEEIKQAACSLFFTVKEKVLNVISKPN